MDRFNDFLETEVSYQDMYEAIVNFIISYDIRCGELEGNSYIVKKMDRDNFIIFLEDVYPDNKIEIGWATSIYKKSLIEKINNFAQSKGIKIICDVN